MTPALSTSKPQDVEVLQMELPAYVATSTEQQKRWADIYLHGTRVDWVSAYEETKALRDAIPELEATTRESLELNDWMHAFYFIMDIIPWNTVMVRREDYRPEDDPMYDDFTFAHWECETERFLITKHCVDEHTLQGNRCTVWVSDADTGKNLGLYGTSFLRKFLREE